jgi:uncharacterized repeat protein (TIGR03803 family)
MNRRYRLTSVALGLILVSSAHVPETFAQASYSLFSGFDLSVPSATLPQNGVIRGSDGAFYGTTDDGNFCGAVYKVAPDGTRSVLHVFKGTTLNPAVDDGCNPVGELVEGPDGLLYGVTMFGGPNASGFPGAGGTGAIYRISPEGDAVSYEVIHFFAGRDATSIFPEGLFPLGGLTLGQDGNFYGTTERGGAFASLGDVNCAGGTFYQLTPARALTIKHAFNPRVDGCSPRGNLTPTRDGQFVGAALTGPLSPNAVSAGTVFMVSPSGALSVLFAFPYDVNAGSCRYGAQPNASPVEGPDGSLYGTTMSCSLPSGGGDSGTVYKLALSASAWQPTLLHRFSGSDGAFPSGSLALASDGNLYGVTQAGGAAAWSNGTIFRVTPTGELTTLHTFNCADAGCSLYDPSDGFSPLGRLFESSPGTFIGTIYGGNTPASFGGGLFKLVIADGTPPVLIVPGPITIVATEAEGARPNASPALAAFLTSPTATDNIDPAPVLFPPQIRNGDVASDTLFPLGTTLVTFRAQDASGNSAKATSRVIVVEPQRRVTGSGYNFPELPAYRATFSITAAGPTVAAGAVQYAYTRTRLNFVSTSVDTVSFSGSTATITGTGSVNGQSAYRFVVHATDAAPDSFEIVITRPDGILYYSSGLHPLVGGGLQIALVQ